MMVRDLGPKLLHYDWILRTDHRNLQHMSTSKDPIIRRWFLEVRFVCRKTQHIPGDCNIIADFLSRQPVDVSRLGPPVLFDKTGQRFSDVQKEFGHPASSAHSALGNDALSPLIGGAALSLSSSSAVHNVSPFVSNQDSATTVRNNSNNNNNLVSTVVRSSDSSVLSPTTGNGSVASVLNPTTGNNGSMVSRVSPMSSGDMATSFSSLIDSGSDNLSSTALVSMAPLTHERSNVVSMVNSSSSIPSVVNTGSSYGSSGSPVVVNMVSVYGRGRSSSRKGSHRRGATRSVSVDTDDGTGNLYRFTDVNGVRIYQTPFIEDLMRLQARDPLITSHPVATKHNVGSPSGDFIYMIGRRFLVPADATSIQERALNLAHTVAGHGGERETYVRLCRWFYWVNMMENVKRWVASCGICQRVKNPQTRQAVGTTTPLVYRTPRYKVQVDFMGPLPMGSDDTYIGCITFCDVATRLLVVAPVESFSAASALDAFNRYYKPCFGIPVEMQVDGGSHFKGIFAKTMEDLGIKVHVSHSNYHESMGIVEKQHDTFLTKVRTELVGPRDKSWATKVFDVAYHINSSRNSSTQLTPFEYMFGDNGSDPISSTIGVSTLPPADRETYEAYREAMRDAAFISATSAAIVSKTYKDKQRDPAPQYKAGDRVRVYFDNRDNKLCAYYRTGYTVVGPSDDTGNFYDVGIKDTETEEVSKVQSVSVTRLRSFDMARTSYQEDEQWKFGPGFCEVKRILKCHRDSDANEIHFEVEWKF